MLFSNLEANMIRDQLENTRAFAMGQNAWREKMITWPNLEGSNPNVQGKRESKHYNGREN